MEDIFVARHSIYDRQLNTVGFELLFHGSDSGCAEFSDLTRSSARLIRSAFMDIGLENVVGSLPAFIHITHDFLVDEQPIPMSPEQVVLEISGSDLPQKAAFRGLRQLVKAGYVIALDGFIYCPELEPLLELATYAKLDLRMHSPEQLRENISHCRNHGVKIMAKGVETADELSTCRELDFDYCMGYHLGQPQIIHGHSTPDNPVLLGEMKSALQAANVDMQSIERMLFRDISLCYKLLRYIDCANYQGRRELDSLHEALVKIGPKTLLKWVTLLLMSCDSKAVSGESSTIPIVRARMCRQLAQLARKQTAIDPKQACTVGLLSGLDKVMGMPMEDLLDTVPLNGAIKIALLDHEGELGKLLEKVLEFERGEMEKPNRTPPPQSDVATLYNEAVLWAEGNIDATVAD